MKQEGVKRNIRKRIIIALLVVIVVVVVAFNLIGNKAIEIAIEKAGSSTLNVPVTMDDLALSLLAGSIHINNFAVANPDGYENPTLLELGTINVDLQTKSLVSDIVNIEEIKLDNMTFTIEQKGLTNNLKAILDSMQKAEEAPDTEEEKAPGKKLHIATLEITNINVKVKLIPLPGKIDTVTLPLPPIKMTDIGGKEKEPVHLPELFQMILQAISKAITEAGAGVLPDAITGPIGEGIGKTSEQLKKLGEGTTDATKKTFDAGADVGKGAVDKTKDLGKGVTDGLKGMVKKK